MQDIKAVFDLGNWYIKGVVIADDDGKTVVLTKDMIKTTGMRKWKILDSDGLTRTINTMAEGFIKKLWGDFIDEIIIGISHPDMQIERVSEQKRVMGEVIGDDDIQHLSKIIAEISGENNYETIKILPVYRTIDDTKKEKDPLWLQWKRLEITADVFRVPKNFYTSILEIFDKLWLNVVDVIPNVLAGAEAVLDYDQKDLWVLFIDIGANQTSYVAYEEWHSLTYGTIPLWWEDVTKDISIGMQYDIKEAEQLKLQYGKIYQEGEATEETSVDTWFLSDIISARYEEIFIKINKNLRKLHKDGRLAGGVVLSWWGSKNLWIEWLSKEIFKLATFDGKERNLHIGELSSNRQFINTLWLYSRAQKYSEGKRRWFGMNVKIFNKVGKFFKDLF